MPKHERNDVMSKYSGYMDKVAKFDLSTGKLETYPWSDKNKELYIGGKMMAAKILYDNLSGKEEAFSEENTIVITTGPLTGTGAPSSARFDVAAISPETGAVEFCNCGGNFGYYLKKAGYDALILTGKCSEHSWLDIYNDSFVLHNADMEGIWGQRVVEAQAAVREILDRDYGCRVKCGIVTIGTAGEELRPYADIFSQERATGKGGIGAVFGWKNLKAIAVAGNHRPTVKNQEKLTAWNKKWIDATRSHALTAKQLPKLGVTEMRADAGELNTLSQGCLSCPIKCGFADVKACGEVDAEREQFGLLGGDVLAKDLDKMLVKMDASDKLKTEFAFMMQNVLESISATGQCTFTGLTALPAESSIEGAVGKCMNKLAPFISFINKHPGIMFFPLSAFYHDREMKYAVGMKMNLGKYMRCGERGYTLEKYMKALFCDGELCQCLADEGNKEALEKLLKAYYAIRSWSKEGVPTEATLKKLGIKKGSN